MAGGGYMACATAIHEATGGAFDDDELEEILSDLQRRARAIQIRTGGTADERAMLKAAAAELAHENALAAKREAANARLNYAKRVARRDRLLAGNDPVLAVQAEIHGVNTPLPGGAKFSAEAESRALATAYQGGAVRALDKAGLFDAARNGTVARDWVRELVELNKPEGLPGVTGSKVAQDIAAVLHRYQALARKGLNAEGAWIGDLDGYVAHQNHDPFAMKSAGFDAWRDFALPKLDAERTFDGVEDRGKFLRGIYNALTTGIHLSAEGGLGFKDPAFTGPGNLAARLSEGRILHFSDADAWLDYQQKFGEPDPLKAVMRGLTSAARDTALMRRWGTNPRAEFQQDMRWAQEILRDSKPDQAVALREGEHGLQTRYDFLDGTNDRPANRLGAQVGSYARLTESLAKLGGVVFTHLSSIGSKASELRYRGVGLFEAYGDALHSIVRGRGAGDTEEMMDLLHAGLEGMQRDILGRFNLGDDLPGAASKAANLFFKLNGLAYFLNAQKAGTQFLLARRLGALLDRDFEDLPPETQRDLGHYGVTPEHWAALQTVQDHASIDGRKFLTPDAAERAGLSDRAGADLASRLAVLYHDAADRAVITPGIPEKALFFGSTRPGTALGEVARFIAQFKQWPAAAIRQGLGRELYGGQSKPAAFAGILHMAVSSAVLGYLAMSAKDLFKGQNPRAPNDPKTWAAALMQGGGFGILGDYLFGEYNRFGQSVSETLLGPVLGQGLSSVIDLWNRAKNGQDLKPEAFRTLLNNTPFLNLFYVRSALNYAFLWQVQEALSPGYLRRFEARVKAQNHQSFWLRPISGVTGANAVRAPSLPGATP